MKTLVFNGFTVRLFSLTPFLYCIQSISHKMTESMKEVLPDKYGYVIHIAINQTTFIS
jgi:hypothetical protein